MKYRYKPRSDCRLREWPSICLWVVLGKPPIDRKKVLVVNDSIRRVRQRIKGYSGEYVQYYERLHPIHSKEEFEQYLDAAKSGEMTFVSNESGIGPEDIDKIRQVEPAPFIFDEETIVSKP